MTPRVQCREVCRRAPPEQGERHALLRNELRGGRRETAPPGRPVSRAASEDGEPLGQSLAPGHRGEQRLGEPATHGDRTEDGHDLGQRLLRCLEGPPHGPGQVAAVDDELFLLDDEDFFFVVSVVVVVLGFVTGKASAFFCETMASYLVVFFPLL